MADKKKKMAAALAAVNAYLQEEQAAAAQSEAPPVSETSSPGMSPWSFSGRQEMMAMRRLVQLRVFDRFR